MRRFWLLWALWWMPDEAFAWLALATLPRAMIRGATVQIWPDGIGGFTNASRRSIELVRADAAAWVDEQTAKQEQQMRDAQVKR